MTPRRRVGLPPGFNLAGAARHTFWRNVFHLVGGYKVRGSAPYEAMVIVANHSSHADTPALIAAFPAPYKPVVVAAEDYWFEKAWMRRGLKLAIGAVPVQRQGGGGYAGLVEGAQAVLGAGSSLLVFPEGTRSPDGRLQELRSGAVRLAREFDVPLLPVAIVGTHDLLPKGGGLHPGPVEVRLGHPIQPEDLVDDDMSPVVHQLEALLGEGPATGSESRTWRTLHRAMDGRAGMAGAAVWGFAEAVSWPVTMEMYLAIVGVANPRRILPAAAWLTAGSVAGVLVTSELTRRGLRPPAPLTTSSMRRAAAEHMATGARGVWKQAVNGVPVKLYAAAAADAGVARLPLAAHTVGARGARAVATAAAMGGAAAIAHPVLRRFYGPYLGVLGVGYAAGLTLVIRSWRRRSG
ncbi:lysophospholipid acyltransferase family protein [Cellulomonas fengjieae]|uniref:1-acyl-sn-glycerol-3-phosphate acyltransferase n=1 Tax=Cellulomonas fengjieae TaxID=2819978 RepID=A0ABS3SCN5_9CELL|nr:lysophospholipid acyltransferase family protein [Cellulomonas fengjieae]MBO3083089.1 1-acyl-sn-glycerol-3-phosphate acyltransferase [Cellulomonas fengjieae]QVI65545.1 1-acyl-sn-glycerol-3-phosphate acyltransferase [Cellulomonas fengjieae]